MKWIILSVLLLIAVLIVSSVSVVVMFLHFLRKGMKQ